MCRSVPAIIHLHLITTVTIKAADGFESTFEITAINLPKGLEKLCPYQQFVCTCNLEVSLCHCQFGVSDRTNSSQFHTVQHITQSF